MLHIVLYQPEIPPNTGNIIRLCANMGAQLHLIHPLGFELSTKQLRRAGLDYHDLTSVHEYQNLDEFSEKVAYGSTYACTTKAITHYSDAEFGPDDALIFGPETRGLPEAYLNTLPADKKIRIPMQPDSRSLNLSNAVAIIAYEAWRQNGFR